MIFRHDMSGSTEERQHEGFYNCCKDFCISIEFVDRRLGRLKSSCWLCRVVVGAVDEVVVQDGVIHSYDWRHVRH